MKLKVGCKLKFISSNIAAYADDLVLLACSVNTFEVLINKISIPLSNLIKLLYYYVHLILKKVILKNFKLNNNVIKLANS